MNTVIILNQSFLLVQMKYLLKLYPIVYPDANINALFINGLMHSFRRGCSNGLIGEHLTMYRIGVQCNSSNLT